MTHVVLELQSFSAVLGSSTYYYHYPRFLVLQIHLELQIFENGCSEPPRQIRQSLNVIFNLYIHKPCNCKSIPSWAITCITCRRQSQHHSQKHSLYVFKIQILPGDWLWPVNIISTLGVWLSNVTLDTVQHWLSDILTWTSNSKHTATGSVSRHHVFGLCFA